MSEESYVEHQIAQGIKARKFIVGKESTDGHTHIVYIRDDEPRASTTGVSDTEGNHEHSIRVDAEFNLYCDPNQPLNHIHTDFTEVDNP